MSKRSAATGIVVVDVTALDLSYQALDMIPIT